MEGIHERTRSNQPLAAPWYLDKGKGFEIWQGDSGHQA
jgi:hypothetical protein